MMIEPSMTKILDKIHNRYMVVNIAAKRARQIADAAKEQDELLDEKPITLALHDIADGKIEIVNTPLIVEEPARPVVEKKAEQPLDFTAEEEEDTDETENEITQEV